MAEIRTPSLLTLTILGRELERSIGSSASITRQGPNRLTSIASATVAGSARLAAAHRSYTVEALFTSTSVRPNRSFTQSAIAVTLSELSTSSWHATIRTPSGSSSLAAISPLRRSREPSTTPKPSRDSWRHTSRPTPRLPPVTTATGRSEDTGTTSADWDRDVHHPDRGCRPQPSGREGKRRSTSPEMSVPCAGAERGCPAREPRPTARPQVAAGILVLSGRCGRPRQSSCPRAGFVYPGGGVVAASADVAAEA